MVVRGWGSSVAIAIGAAAATSAAQLGLAYGMDVISWAAATGERAGDAWTAGLAWAVWVAASSTIVGAIVAGRLSPQVDPDRELPDSTDADDDRGGGAGLRGVLGRLVLAVAAALGAAATVVLVAVPARVVEIADTANPQTVAAGYAMLGVLAGLPFAVIALTARAVAANLLATGGWLWLLAIAAVTDGVLAGRDWTRIPLGFWDLPASGPWLRNILLPDAAVAAGAALLIGALVALAAARRGDRPVGVACSGAVGPLLVAIAYLFAQPDLAGAAALDLSRQLAVPYLTVLGLLGSLLVTALPVAGRSTPPPAGRHEDGGGEAGDAAVPSPRKRRRQTTDAQVTA